MMTDMPFTLAFGNMLKVLIQDTRPHFESPMIMGAYCVRDYGYPSTHVLLCTVVHLSFAKNIIRSFEITDPVVRLLIYCIVLAFDLLVFFS